MTKNKNARPAGGTAEQADQEKRRESGNSYFHLAMSQQTVDK